MRCSLISIAMGCLLICCTRSALAQPATQPGVGRFPHVEVDVKSRKVRVDCEALRVDMPLEFFCVTAGSSEHESVLRTRAKPSHIHTAMLMVGLQPGEPVKYSEAAKKWFPPHGPPLQISVEFDKDGKHYAMPAYKLMREIRSKNPMPPMNWIFAGSRILDEGKYAADITGYVVSVVNFELTMIDIPKIAGSANETLEWETNLDLLPALGAPVTMIIEPMQGGGIENIPAIPATPATRPAAISDVSIDQARVDRARELWDRQVKPHGQALREAAQAQYEVIRSLRREQQRLIDEADRIQRLIDELDRQYQQMTTPQPEGAQSRE